MNDMLMSIEEWFEKARKGTSGDMVFDILCDWKKDRDQLIQAEPFKEKVLKSFEALVKSKECRKFMENYYGND